MFRQQNLLDLVIPPDGEEFELTLEHHVRPIGDMVRKYGYYPELWDFSGSQVVVPQTRQFKLVRLSGSCRGLGEVQSRLAEYGKIPQGQWREALSGAYPYNDGRGPIGVADPSWLDPFGHANFPALFGAIPLLGWESLFAWADEFVFNAQWRWLVERDE